MSRKRVRQKKVPALLAELEERGVTEVRRHPPRLDGTVLVTWREPGALREEGGDAGELRPFMPAFIMSVTFAVLVLAVVMGLLLSRAP